MTRLGLVVAAGLLLTACTSGPPSTSGASPSPTVASASSAGPRPDGTTSAGPTPSAQASASAGPSPSGEPPRSRRLHLAVAARIPLAGQTHGRALVTWGNYAAWAGCRGCDGASSDHRTVYVADLRTRRVRAVLTAPPRDHVLPLGGSGSVLVYVTAVVARDGSIRWTAHAQDVSGRGGRRTLAALVQRADGMPPTAVVGTGRLVYQVPSRDSSRGFRGPVTAVDLGTGAVRLLVRDLPGMLRAVTPLGLLHLAGDPPETLMDGPTDAVLSGAGPAPRVLSDTHDVADVVADGATAAWQTTDGADAAVWAVPLDRVERARLYHRGGTGDVAVGRGFLAVVTAGDAPVLRMYPLAGGQVVTAADIPVESDSVATDGPRLAYLALPGERGQPPDARHPLQLVAGTVELPTLR